MPDEIGHPIGGGTAGKQRTKRVVAQAGRRRA
jgi:hypothetical protein